MMGSPRIKFKRRVLFLERNLRNEKLGIMYLSAGLKVAGHHANMIQTDKQNLDESIRDYRPDFVAFSITTGEHTHALETARDIKRHYGIPNIFGGPHCTFFPELAYQPEVDFVVQGQGEGAIVDIVEGRAAPGFLKADLAAPLSEHLFPDRDIFYQYAEFRDNPMKNVITSRACPYRCSYCFNHSQLALARMDGRTRQWFKRRSPESVVGEINTLRDRYPLDKVLYIDDSFVQNRDWLDAFLAEYGRQVELPWLCSLRVNHLTERLAERMSQSGLEMVNYALESADPDVQQRLLNRGHISNRDIIRAISLFDRFGVRARMQNMIGLPLSNTLEDALNTLQFNIRHRVTDSWCSIFQPYPRTALGQYCVDHGYATADQLRHCSESFFDESRIAIGHKKELHALQKMWYFVVLGAMPIDLVQILIRGELTRDSAEQLQQLRFRSARSRLYGIAETGPEQMSDDHDSKGRAQQIRETGTGPYDAGRLLRAALGGTAVPARFVEILAAMPFALRERERLQGYIDGRRAYEPPLYTVDDETGELVDPRVSIYVRGTADPDGSDIRLMSESHFMGNMKDVRDTLLQEARPGDRDDCKAQRAHVNVPVGVGQTTCNL